MYKSRRKLKKIPFKMLKHFNLLHSVSSLQFLELVQADVNSRFAFSSVQLVPHHVVGPSLAFAAYVVNVFEVRYRDKIKKYLRNRKIQNTRQTRIKYSQLKMYVLGKGMAAHYCQQAESRVSCKLFCGQKEFWKFCFWRIPVFLQDLLHLFAHMSMISDFI